MNPLNTSNDLDLPFILLDFEFQHEGPLQLPPYAGSAWRGALGWALKRTVCVVQHTPCPQCLLYRSCVFPYLYETPPPQDSRKLRKYPTAPHPFVLRIKPGQKGPQHRLGLVLIGNAYRQLPYFIHALEQAGRQGIGSRRQPFKLQTVSQSTGPDHSQWTTLHTPGGAISPLTLQPAIVPNLPDRLVIHLETPLRLRQHDHLVTPAQFSFGHFFTALLRRLSLLSYFHTDQPWETDFGRLIRQAQGVPHHHPKLHWYDWTRYSSRQETTLEMGGLLGQFELHGPDITELWPLLWLGQWTHAGKGATLGLGQYRVELASLPTPDVAQSAA